MREKKENRSEQESNNKIKNDVMFFFLLSSSNADYLFLNRLSDDTESIPTEKKDTVIIEIEILDGFA